VSFYELYMLFHFVSSKVDESNSTHST